MARFKAKQPRKPRVYVRKPEPTPEEKKAIRRREAALYRARHPEKVRALQRAYERRRAERDGCWRVTLRKRKQEAGANG